MKEKPRSLITAAGAKAACLSLTLGAALLTAPGPAPRAQAPEVEAKPREVKLGVKRGKKKTDLKLFFERGALTQVTATDSAGTRSLRRVDKLAVPCADEGKECKTVEMEDGTLVGVCYCKKTPTAILLPAVQKTREHILHPKASTSSGPHVKVFSGQTGEAANGSGQGTACWADEKLGLSVCKE